MLVWIKIGYCGLILSWIDHLVLSAKWLLWLLVRRAFWEGLRRECLAGSCRPYLLAFAGLHLLLQSVDRLAERTSPLPKLRSKCKPPTDSFGWLAPWVFWRLLGTCEGTWWRNGAWLPVWIHSRPHLNWFARQGQANVSKQASHWSAEPRAQVISTVSLAVWPMLVRAVCHELTQLWWSTHLEWLSKVWHPLSTLSLRWVFWVCCA